MQNAQEDSRASAPVYRPYIAYIEVAEKTAMTIQSIVVKTRFPASFRAMT